jgi:hypothetical protein
VPNSWRVIATMNVFDKSLLFEMSFALMRRFAFIEVASPPDEVFRELIFRAAAGNDVVTDLTVKFLPLRAYKDLGPALFMDIARYLATRVTLSDSSPDQLAFEAFYSFLLPQFEGVDEIEGDRMFKEVRQIVGTSNAERLRRTLEAVLGLDLTDSSKQLSADETEQTSVAPDD